MGLDTYAARSPSRDLTDEDLEAFEAAKPELCGGIESGGYESFRGKVYADLVENMTGVSLYQEWIPPETVQEMSEALEQCDPEEVIHEFTSEYRWYAPSPSEVIELRKFFRICHERNLGLVGWW